jgi:hypothetical protein
LLEERGKKSFSGGMEGEGAAPQEISSKKRAHPFKQVVANKKKVLEDVVYNQENESKGLHC